MKIINIKTFFIASAIFIVMPSAIMHYFLGFNNQTYKVLYLIVSILCLLLIITERKFSLPDNIKNILIIIFGFGFIASILSGDMAQLLMAVCLCINVFIVVSGFSENINKGALKYILIIGWIFVLGGFVGVIYAFSGGQPINIIDLGNRYSYLYLTTFTDQIKGNIIRPSGIFDEPGSLAMFNTVIIVLNTSFNINTKWTKGLLYAGIISGSLTMLIILITSFFYEKKIKNILVAFVVIVGVFVFGLSDTRVSTFIDEIYFQRIEINDGRLSGDNRSNQIDEFIEMYDQDIFMKGYKIMHKDDYAGNSSNPLSIFFWYGFFIWVPYVLTEIWLLYGSFFYKHQVRFPAMAMFITLLQRPYLYDLRWSMMIVTALFVIYGLEKNLLKENIE
jgi:hypothetical protein